MEWNQTRLAETNSANHHQQPQRKDTEVGVWYLYKMVAQNEVRTLGVNKEIRSVRDGCLHVQQLQI